MLNKVHTEYECSTKERFLRLVEALNENCFDVSGLQPEVNRTASQSAQYPVYVQLWDDRTLSLSHGSPLALSMARSETYKLLTVPEKYTLDFRGYGSVRATAPSPQSVLAEAEHLINGDRAAAYGKVSDNFGLIAVGWQGILGTTVSPEQVGLCMAWLKMARQVHNPKRDNLVDAAGYIGCIDKIGRE